MQNILTHPHSFLVPKLHLEMPLRAKLYFAWRGSLGRERFSHPQTPAPKKWNFPPKSIPKRILRMRPETRPHIISP